MDASVNQKQDRIRRARELLGERYSVGASCRSPCCRDIEHVLTAAQRTASWCTAALAGLDRQRRSQGTVSQLIYAEAASGAGDDHDFYAAARISRASISNAAARCGFQLYNTLGIVRGDKARMASRRWRTTISSARRMSPSSYSTSRSGSTARSIAAPMSPFHAAGQALGSALFRSAAYGAPFRTDRRHFKLADNRRVSAAISFGFGDNAHKVNSYAHPGERRGYRDVVKSSAPSFSPLWEKVARNRRPHGRVS